jgi:hypothetical protein
MSIREWLGWSSAVTAFVLVAGCSSNGGGGHCGGFSACGGDISGTWNVTSSCVEGNLTAFANYSFQDDKLACNGTYDTVTANVTGTVSFEAGKATNNTVTTIDFVMVPTKACLEAFDVTTVNSDSCAAFGQALVDGDFHTAATCVVEGNGCRCSNQNRYTRNEVLAYAVNGSKVTYETDTDSLDFCIAGTTLNARQFETDLASTIFFDATRAN